MICYECLARGSGYDSSADMMQKLFIEDNLSTSEIAKRLGVDRKSVSKELSRLSIYKRVRNRIDLSDFPEGFTAREAAKQLHCHISTVYSLHRQGRIHLKMVKGR